jgi:hypothetical protein
MNLVSVFELRISTNLLEYSIPFPLAATTHSIQAKYINDASSLSVEVQPGASLLLSYGFTNPSGGLSSTRLAAVRAASSHSSDRHHLQVPTPSLTVCDSHGTQL